MKRRLSALLAILVGLASVGATVVVAPRGSASKVGANILINPAGLTSQNSSPTIVRDPQHPEHLVVAHRIDRPGLSALLNWSDDGGRTWRPTVLPLPPADEPCAGSLDQQPCPFAPDVAFAPDGTLYVIYVQLQGAGNSPARLWLATSSNGGRSIDTPVPLAGPLAFQPRLAIGLTGTVHIVWLQADDVGTNSIVGPARVLAVRSTDRGRTFSPPTTVSGPSRPRVGAPTVIVDSAGRVVVLYEDFKGDRRDFENLEGPPSDDPFALVVSSSADDGSTFSSGVELEDGIIPARRFLVYLPEQPSLAAGPEGVLYVAWTDGRGGDEDVLLRRSDDGGATWAAAARVNRNRTGDGTDQRLPQVSVSPAGRVDVVFYDRRRDPGNIMTDAFLASSNDRGRTFTDRRLSSVAFDSRVGFSLGPAYGTDFGTRLGLDSTGAEAYAVWTDSRLGNQDTGRHDLLGAAVRGLEPSRSWLWLLWPVLSCAGGLMAWYLLSRRTPTGAWRGK